MINRRASIARHGFAAADDVPIQYLKRVREYYKALGYGAPYEWAHYTEVPFHPSTTPSSKCRIALITTAAPYRPDKGDQGPGAPYNTGAKFYTVYSEDTAKDHDLRISHIAIDRKRTTADGPGHLLSLEGNPRECGIGSHRVSGFALPWPTDQSQPSGHARGRLPGNRGPLLG